MKRKTAYQMAIAALKEKQGRQYAFDYNMYVMFELAGQDTGHLKNSHSHYIRIEKAIEILVFEKKNQQYLLDLD